ncbi:PaaI family thioesterase [Sulfitobacter guttiformis]|uniref:Acyl-coenzyme A thioesterase PaaI-like protein n=1 Tax=Sulfitobacter guttiformis TaxID=74349 RepID=A0A420DPX3_9RHOB|nr:PaaI family thioesterase [Sulfitobacter guttiformis]KIN73625.1 Thioesterase-like protein [Sulfitobacter guttiformis KCTC 32187]RKE96272.1 acyl-coenzyme A thioesterase PaaI-like protein [Sulfitobacter guttiformis]
MTIRKRPEPVQVIKQRRDAALHALAGAVPYIRFLGIEFERRGDELTAIMPFKHDLIGNPLLPALHGGATAAFLEITAVMTLNWTYLWDDLEAGKLSLEGVAPQDLPRLPKTVDFTVDYLRTGLPRDAYARARITRAGRRYASVQVGAWQDNREKLYAQAMGHFVMPAPRD